MSVAAAAPLWTPARALSLRECARRFWYETRLARAGAAPGAPAVARIAHRLGAALPFEERVAEEVRRALAADLAAVWEGRAEPPHPADVRDRLRRAWRESRERWPGLEGLADAPPPRRHRPIREIVYGEAGDVRAATDALEPALERWTASRARAEWTDTPRPAVAWLAEPGGPAPEAALDGARLAAAPLLVRWEGDALEIGHVRWDRSDGEEPRGRRAARVLWVALALGAEAAALRWRTLTLPAGREEAGPVDPGDLDALRARLARDVREMKGHAAVDGGPPRDAATRFPRRDEAEVCGICRFRQLCPPGDTEEPPWID
ncbi:MAG TPA: hypothetical protein VKU85_10760 [bacterium]|nr:hypothetical protein [bacterium]